MRDIKRHIRSVSSTRQITRAMELVASVKMRKARERLERTRPYFQSIEEAINDITMHTRDIQNDLINPREVKKTCYIIITADRGLAGGYNANVIRTAQSHMKEKGEVSVITIGQKAKEHFRKTNLSIDGEFTQISEDPTYAHAKNIRSLCIELYNQGLVDEVYLVYTGFLSTISYKPTVTRLLPLASGEKQEDDRPKVSKLMLYEPSPGVVLDYLIPKYIESMIFGALIESAASEQSARRIAMKNATDNAGEIIEDLQLKYNRARQASITQEIAEIVGGAEALN